MASGPRKTAESKIRDDSAILFARDAEIFDDNPGGSINGRKRRIPHNGDFLLDPANLADFSF
jgi:hypothetical protein